MIPFSFLFFYFSTLALVLYVEVSVLPYAALFLKKLFRKFSDFPCKLLFQKSDINNRRKIIFLVAAKTQKFEPLPKED